MEELVKILMYRDGIDRIEAEKEICFAKRMVDFGESPEVVLARELKLEPDYAHWLM